jgi:hypothetical protein
MAASSGVGTRLGGVRRWLLVAGLAIAALGLVSVASAGSFAGGQPPAGAGPSTESLGEQPRLLQPDGSAPAPPVATGPAVAQPSGTDVQGGPAAQAAPVANGGLLTSGRADVGGRDGADAPGGRTDAGGMDGAERSGVRSD